MPFAIVRRAWLVGALALVACREVSPGDLDIFLDPGSVTLEVSRDPDADALVTATVAVANVGDVDAEITSISLLGDDAFRVRADVVLPSRLAPGEVLAVELVLADGTGLPEEGDFERRLDLVVEATGETEQSAGCGSEVIALSDTAAGLVLIAPGASPLCDVDEDGFEAVACGGPDCDDGDPAVFPDAAEVCNLRDDDCDGLADEEAIDAPLWFLDADLDGFGLDTASIAACEPPIDAVAQGGDCDDADATVSPSGVEVCNTRDDDCDGTIDEGTPVRTWYADVDLDGHGDAATATDACAQVPGAVELGDDCDDADASAFPGALEYCDGADDDCDGTVDEADAVDAPTWHDDGDGDGFGVATGATVACVAPPGTVADGTDCDDANAAVNPAADDVCNALDDDCDGVIDDGAAQGTWYVDADADGFGDPSSAVVDCFQPPGTVPDGTDCDDTAATTNPSAPEVCNGADDDCDGEIDVGATDTTVWYRDGDGDLFGDSTRRRRACTAPTGFVADPGDCDDANPAINPGAPEACNGIDDDCDGTADGTSTLYADTDGDGFGDPSSTTTGPVCAPPPGFVPDDTDCDDTDPAVNPAATEACNGVDDDCDAEIDEAGAVGGTPHYADADGDSYGDPSDAVDLCAPEPGRVDNALDCDDADPAINPAATETCDGVDQDCDGVVDDNASDAITWYADADGDGYGDPGVTTLACRRPPGFVRNRRDCNDGDPAINPGASEVCNGVDDNCNGSIDDNAVDAQTFFPDADADTYGDDTGAVTACTRPPGTVTRGGDCDDGNPFVNPRGTESCDGLDNDCSGFADDGGAGCPCPVEYGPDGDAYLMCTISIDWQLARQACGFFGYHLVTIDDDAENAWIDATIDGYSPGRWWFGFNDVTAEGRWAWVDGSPVGFENWAPGEPNNAGGNEDCGELNRFPGGTWNDSRCGDSKPFVCEAD